MDLCPRISFKPSDGAKAALVSLGRTEDVQFSPDDRRLAIVGFKQNKVLILDIKIKNAKRKILILCEDWLEITSPFEVSLTNGNALNFPSRGGDFRFTFQ